MSAPNFSCRTNSRYIYAFCEPSDFEAYKNDLKENDPDYYEENEDYLEGDYAYNDWYEDEKDYYLNWLSEALSDAAKDHQGLDIDFMDLSSGRVYDGTELAVIKKSITFAGIDFEVALSLDFEAGYYAGFAIDWNYKNICDFDGCNLDELSDEDLAEALRDYHYWSNSYAGLNAGLSKALAPKLRKRLAEAISEASEVIEQALQTVSPYHLTGFCLGNGEGIYTNHRKAS